MTRVETDVATALTRASRRLQKRQPPRRFPSPWTEAVDFLCFPQRRATPMLNFFARSGAKIEKIDSLIYGGGYTLAEPKAERAKESATCAQRPKGAIQD